MADFNLLQKSLNVWSLVESVVVLAAILTCKYATMRKARITKSSRKAESYISLSVFDVWLVVEVI